MHTAPGYSNCYIKTERVVCAFHTSEILKLSRSFDNTSLSSHAKSDPAGVTIINPPGL